MPDNFIWSITDVYDFVTLNGYDSIPRCPAYKSAVDILKKLYIKPKNKISNRQRQRKVRKILSEMDSAQGY